MDIFLIIDLSHDMNKYLLDMKNLLTAFLTDAENLGNATDQIAIITLGETANLKSPKTNDYSALKKIIDELTFLGQTPNSTLVRRELQAIIGAQPRPYRFAVFTDGAGAKIETVCFDCWLQLIF